GCNPTSSKFIHTWLRFGEIMRGSLSNRHITGVTLTTQGSLSIGRERKRFISSLIHKYKLGLLDPDTSYYLQGLLSFAIYIEPDFRVRMSKKYSTNTVTEIIKLRKEDEAYRKQ
ncbi:hypothetical protein POX07_24070, partial [Klebsiella pneumoniae]